MRLNDLVGKEMVNIYDGMRMGTVGESDMVIDEETGDIVSIILPNKGNLLNFWVDRQKLIIPWSARWKHLHLLAILQNVQGVIANHQR
jgi:YlmC/YmxH family sporulation protein